MNDDERVICIIDDDVSAREGMASLAQSAGFHVQTFTTAQEYLTEQRDWVPACLVLDIAMPGLSGIDLQSELLRRGIDVPIVFVSGHADVSLSVRALKAGAADFLTKPFEPNS